MVPLELVTGPIQASTIKTKIPLYLINFSAVLLLEFLVLAAFLKKVDSVILPLI